MPQQRRRSQRPPILRRPPAIPKGPRLFTAAPDRGQVSIFVTPPPGFVMGTTSGSEWVMYAAMSKVLGYPDDPTIGPYYGYPGLWEYQSNFDGGRRELGGAVVDFVVNGATTRVPESTLIRLQTEEYHYYTDFLKQASDMEQMKRMLGVARVVDVLETQILGDPSGYRACRVVAEALAYGGSPNPLESGTIQRARSIWRPGR